MVLLVIIILKIKKPENTLWKYIVDASLADLVLSPVQNF